MENRRWAGIIIAIVLFGTALFGLHSFVSIDDLRQCDEKPTSGECARADAIVVVSGGDTEARVQEALELYDNGWAPKLIVSGAAQDISGPSNAVAMQQQAIEAGVPATAIIIDESARNTSQNASESAELARVNDVRNIIVVTSPYHLTRATLVFEREFAGIGAVRSHPSDNDHNWPGNWWLTGRGWWLVGGEMLKSVVELMPEAVSRE